MSSKVVKCPNCNVVINEVLAFICNKVDVMDVESISRISVSAFSESDILNAKNLLFDSLPSTRRKKIRKRQGKTVRDIDDIICLIKESDPEDFPIFVAKDLQKLPPVLFDHVDVTRLLKDIVRIQGEIQEIKDQYVCTGQLNELKQDLESLKKASIVNNFNACVNTKRGACLMNSFSYDSGPMGLPPLHDEVPIITVQQSLHSDLQDYRNIARVNCVSECDSIQVSPVQMQAASEQSVSADSKQRTGFAGEATTQVANELRGKRASSAEAMTHPQPVPAPAAVMRSAVQNDCISANTSQKTLADTVRGGVWKPEVLDDDWIKVQRKRLRNRFVGS